MYRSHTVLSLLPNDSRCPKVFGRNESKSDENYCDVDMKKSRDTRDSNSRRHVPSPVMLLPIHCQYNRGQVEFIAGSLSQELFKLSKRRGQSA